MKKLLLSMYIMKTEHEVFISTPHIDTEWWKELWDERIEYNDFRLITTPSYASPMAGAFYLTTAMAPQYSKLQYHVYNNSNPTQYINKLIMVIFKATFRILKKRLGATNVS